MHSIRFVVLLYTTTFFSFLLVIMSAVDACKNAHVNMNMNIAHWVIFPLEMNKYHKIIH